MGNISNLKQDLELIVSVCSLQQKQFYEKMLSDLKECEVVSVYDLFDADQIDLMKSLVITKECYRNAYLISMCFPNVSYVEGRVLCVIPIDHAFNCIDGKFFDATLELVVGDDVTKMEYAYLAKYDLGDIEPIVLERGYYGEIYKDSIIKEIKSKEQK